MNSSCKTVEQQEQNTMTCVNESFVFNLSLKDYILRLLILGSSENKYDPRNKGLSVDNIKYIKTQITSGHGEEICNIVRDVYKEGRAPKQDATMMVIGLICRAEDVNIRKMGLQLLENFKTISHLYSWKKFHASIENHATGQKSKGFGRAVKRQINDWILSYRGKPQDLAYQITKYMAREGWSFKNILQCTHVKTGTGDDRIFEEKEGTQPKHKSKVNKNTSPPTELDLVLRYAVNGYEAMVKLARPNLLTTKVYEYLTGVHTAMKMSMIHNKDLLIELIYTHKLTREQIPTWGLVDKEVLSALLMNKNKTRVAMPLTALLRNLGNLTIHDVLNENDKTTLDLVIKHLLHPNTIKFSKIHPVSVLTAWFTYRNGIGNRGHNSWYPVLDIVQTLEKMFYLSFSNVEPTGKRICFLIDGSGSMGAQSSCEGITCAESAALLAMIFTRCETTSEISPDHSFYIFTSNSSKYNYNNSTTGLTDVSDVIDADADFNKVLGACQRSDWGTTDISIGILEALKYKRKYDAFVVITDNDVNSGIKPSEAMKHYRVGMKMPNTKLAVVATLGTDYTIADPNDPLMMDMVGFDSHGPKILQDFIRS
jgi:60 kDa SS-A/Ro ribonucleoprotein